jgi:hypothetical protein
MKNEKYSVTYGTLRDIPGDGRGDVFKVVAFLRGTGIGSFIFVLFLDFCRPTYSLFY